MSEYLLVKDESLIAIADKVRALSGTTDPIGINDIVTNLETTQNDISSVFDSIANKGGTIPPLKIISNLETAIDTISTGAELNFNIVGGTTEPENPTENMIWVNTDTHITGYHFASTQPVNIAEGEVWFVTEKSNSINFNVLKENNVTVYPSAAKQLIAGEAKDVSVKIYQDGKWSALVESPLWLYRIGYNLEANFVAVDSNTSTANGITSTGWGAVRTATKFDFSAAKYKKIVAKVYMGSRTYDYPLNLVVTSSTDKSGYNPMNENNAPNAVAYGRIRTPSANAVNTITCNIENITGQYYIGLGLGYHNGTVVRELYLEA